MGKQFIIRTLLCFCLCLGWWGLLYPELLIGPDTCRVVCEEDAGEEMQEQAGQMTAQQLYRALEEADRGQVRYRSKLLELLGRLWDRCGKGLENGS